MRWRWLPLLVLSCACRLDAFDAVTGGVVASDAGTDAALVLPDAGCGDTESDRDNCGACGARCEPSAFADIACVDARCIERNVSLLGARPGVLHGSASGGGAYPESQLCGENEVLLGISGVGSTIAYGMAVHCGRIALEAGNQVKVVPTNQALPVGGNIAPPPAPYERLCPEGAIVTGVAGATWIFPNTTTRSIRQLTLTCSRVLLDPAGELVFAELPDALTIGDAADATAEPFDDPCGVGGAVAGFSGRSGAYLDALAVHCGTVLTLDRQVEPVNAVTDRAPVL